MNAKRKPKPKMSAHPSFIDTQYRFTAHLRDPNGQPAPADVPDRRMQAYRELIYNNLEAGVAFCYPIAKELLGEELWHSLVREFMINHRSQKHYYRQIPGEFLDYMLNEHNPSKDEPPFLNQLLHYEWAELALLTSEEEIPTAGVDPKGDLLSGQPLISPLAWLLSYDYPVHKIDPEFQPERPTDEQVFLIVYRDRQDEIGFMEANAVTARLFALLDDETGLSGRQALETIAEEIKHPDPDVVIEGGRAILEDLRSRDVIVGCRR